MLKLSHITKSFNNTQILKNINIFFNKTDLSVIEGQNGAGKSTLFNILCGYIMPDFGNIYLSDQNISTLNHIERSKFMAVLVQDPKLSTVQSLSVLENFHLAYLKNQQPKLKIAINNDFASLVIKHCNSFGYEVNNLLNKDMGLLSGGQRQILAFLMATIKKAKILLLDEPTAALDEKSKILLMEMIRKIKKDWNIPAIMISHDKELNQKYADIIFKLENGKIN